MPTAELEVEPHSISAQEIEIQLQRMLESHHFCHSHRYPALLKYLVQQTKEGKGPQLKERLLGIEVFHRAPDYDTNTDPVVRVTAAEVRKRIAQYYQEPEHSDELRIDLPTGSYVPRFTLPHGSPSRLPAVDIPAHPAPASPGANGTEERSSASVPSPVVVARRTLVWRQSYWGIVATAACFGILLAVASWFSVSAVSSWRERAVRRFWAPLATGAPVLMVIGDHTIGAQGNALRAKQGAAVNPAEDVLQLMNEHEQITLSDVTSLFKITDYMSGHNQNYTAEGAGNSSIDDLRNGPVLLFAGLDNRWTMRLTEHLRFRFVDSDDDTIGTIQDAQDPSRRWQVDFKTPYTKFPMDYAIVARYYDPLIEQPVMIAAGIGETGTVSASEFVTSERLIEDMDKLAPKGWHHGNVEVVLATPVIDGHPGPPHIIASQFW